MSSVMPRRLASLNENRNRICLDGLNDLNAGSWYYRRMGKPTHDWYLNDWLRYFKKRQADVVRDLDWNKAKVSLTASGKQPYTRDDVNDMAAYLNLHPYELLMHPDDAHAIRALRNDAARIMASAAFIDPVPQKNVSTG